MKRILNTFAIQLVSYWAIRIFECLFGACPEVLKYLQGSFWYDNFPTSRMNTGMPPTPAVVKTFHCENSNLFMIIVLFCISGIHSVQDWVLNPLKSNSPVGLYVTLVFFSTYTIGQLPQFYLKVFKMKLNFEGEFCIICHFRDRVTNK